MSTLLTYLKLFPVILSAVRSLEEAIPLPAAGKQKLDLLLAVVKEAHEAEEVIRSEVPWAKLAGMIGSLAKAIVGFLNAAGIFRRSTA